MRGSGSREDFRVPLYPSKFLTNSAAPNSVANKIDVRRVVNPADATDGGASGHIGVRYQGWRDRSLTLASLTPGYVVELLRSTDAA